MRPTLKNFLKLHYFVSLWSVSSKVSKPGNIEPFELDGTFGPRMAPKEKKGREARRSSCTELLGVSDPRMVTLNPMKERRLRGWKSWARGAQEKKRKEKKRKKNKVLLSNQILTLGPA
jgi:hypothetical protein